MKFKLLKALFLGLLLISRAILAQSNLTVTATSVAPDAPSAYIFSFNIDGELSPAAAMGVVFPAGFDLSRVALADSRSVDGGLSVQVRQDTVWAMRSGRGKTIVSGTRVDIILAAIAATNQNSTRPEFILLHREPAGLRSRAVQRSEINLRSSNRRQN